MARILTYSLLLVLALVPARAQESRGAIVGRVIDSSGAIVPDASVRCVNPATNTGASARTNRDGNYELPYLVPGLYRIEVTATGFKKFLRDGIEVRVDDRLAVDAQLEVGNMTEVLTVTAESPALETATASLGAVVEGRRITELPVTDGNPWMLAGLVPGVTSYVEPAANALPGATDKPANISIDGSPKQNAEFSLDGSPNMAGTSPAFIPPADIVEEFKVQTATFDAAVGHTMAGSLNAVIKSGTNKIHGSLWEFNTSGRMRGTDFFTNKFIYDPTTGPITAEKIKANHGANVLNRYGGVFNGPVYIPKLYNGRNRTFFSYGYQAFARRTADNAYQNVPPVKQRTGDFSDLLAISSQYQIYDPATTKTAANGRLSRQPFTGNIVPPSRIDPMALRILKYWPDPNTAGTPDGRNNYSQSLPFSNDYWGHTGRLDHVFSDNHRVFGRIMKSLLTNDTNHIFPNNPSVGDNRNRKSDSAMLDDVYVVSPTFIANVRFGVTRFDEANGHSSTGFDIVSLGFPASLAAQLDPRGITFPQISINGVTNIGSAGGDRTALTYYNWGANFTHMAGNHSIRFGGEYRILQENGITWGNVSPVLNFAASWTKGPLDNAASSPQGIGQGLASFLLGLPTGGGIDFNPFYAEASHFTGFYAQDDWKLTRKLTINLGLRYEWESPTTERYNRSVAQYDFKTPSPLEAQARTNYAQSPIPQIPADQFHAIGGLTFAGVGGKPRQLWNTDRNNVAPRIGLAWSVTQKLVFRAGYGHFFGQLGVDKRSVNLDGFSLRNALNPSLDNGLTFVATLQNPFPTGLQLPRGAAGGLLTNAGQSVSFFDPNPANPYMQRWSISGQYALPHRVTFELAYVGNRGHDLGISRGYDPVPAQYLSRLPYRDQAVNDFNTALVNNPFYPMLPGTGLSSRTVARSQLLRPYPQFTGISASQNTGYSFYNALQLRVDKRFSSGFTVQGSYTWSKFMTANAYLNPTDSRPEYVVADQDRPQRLILSGIYELPFGRGGKFGRSLPLLKDVIGGWQVQGIYTGQSGPPIGFGDIFFYGDVHDIPLPRNQRTPDLWFNRDAGFVRASAQQPVNHIRDMPSNLTGLRADGQNFFNLSAIKNFPLHESLRLQFRAEAQNALNHAHFKSPNTNPVNQLFGTCNATVGEPRYLALALKLLW